MKAALCVRPLNHYLGVSFIQFLRHTNDKPGRRIGAVQRPAAAIDPMHISLDGRVAWVGFAWKPVLSVRPETPALHICPATGARRVSRGLQWAGRHEDRVDCGDAGRHRRASVGKRESSSEVAVIQALRGKNPQRSVQKGPRRLEGRRGPYNSLPEAAGTARCRVRTSGAQAPSGGPPSRS